MMNLRLVMMRGVDRLDLPGIEPHQISGVGAVSKRRGRQAIKGKPLKKLPQSLLARCCVSLWYDRPCRYSAGADPLAYMRRGLSRGTLRILIKGTSVASVVSRSDERSQSAHSLVKVSSGAKAGSSCIRSLGPQSTGSVSGG
jgi:hypothetical protein